MILQQKPTIRRIPRTGFTLMEVMAVVAIVLVLASLGGVFFFGQMNESKKSTALTQIRGTLTTAVEMYALKHGQYPNDLSVLIQPDPANGNAPYLKSRDVLIDPWGNPYKIDPSGAQNSSQGNTQPDIFSMGPPGGSPIGNWQSSVSGN